MAPIEALGLLLAINGLGIAYGYSYYNNSPKRISVVFLLMDTRTRS